MGVGAYSTSQTGNLQTPNLRSTFSHHHQKEVLDLEDDRLLWMIRLEPVRMNEKMVLMALQARIPRPHRNLVANQIEETILLRPPLHLQ